MICNSCGTDNPDGAIYCKSCGQKLQTGEPQTGNTNTYSGPVEYNSTVQSVTENEKVGSSTASIISLILGIVSIVCCCTNIIGIVCGIVAIVLACKEKKEGRGNNLATAGLICGIIGAVLGGISLIMTIISVVTGNVSYYYNF